MLTLLVHFDVTKHSGSMDQLCIQIDAFFDQVRDMTPEQRTQHLKSMTTLLKETSAANEQKVNLAAQAYDLVSMLDFLIQGRPAHSSFG
jgi:hypothetical protein